MFVVVLKSALKESLLFGNIFDLNFRGCMSMITGMPQGTLQAFHVFEAVTDFLGEYCADFSTSMKYFINVEENILNSFLMAPNWGAKSKMAPSRCVI